MRERIFFLCLLGFLLISCAMIFQHFQPETDYAPVRYAIVETSPTDLTRKTDLHFQQVEEVSAPLFIYSALREDNSVRIVALKERKAAIKDLHCVFSNDMLENATLFSINAIVTNIPENHGSVYTAAYITCQVDKEQIAPVYVGLVSKKNLKQKPKYFILVEDVRSAFLGEEREVEFGVCIPPMFHNFHNAAQLVEMLEMNRLLGAGRVVLYNNSIAQNVDVVLDMYLKEFEQGNDSLEVRVFPWQLPTIVENGVRKEIVDENDIHYLGQMAAIDHCLHRYRHSSRFLVFVDLDEIIIPVHHANWSEFIAEQQKKKATKGNFAHGGSKEITGFLFQSTVFNKNRLSPPPKYEKDALRFGSDVLGITSRDSDFLPPSLRTKLIVNPKKVNVMGIHFIWEGSGPTYNVPIADGFLAHYRMPLFECKPQVIDTTVVDKFGAKLAERLSEVWSRLPGVELGWAPVKKSDVKSC